MSRAYATEAERTEARRRAYRDSKARKTSLRQREKNALEDYVRLLISSGNGPAWRRDLMLEILQKQRGQ